MGAYMRFQVDPSHYSEYLDREGSTKVKLPAVKIANMKTSIDPLASLVASDLDEHLDIVNEEEEFVPPIVE